MAIEQEIARLEQELASKRQQMEREGVSPEQMPSEREMIHESVGERIQETAPQYQPAPAQPQPAQPAPAATDDEGVPEELREPVQQLVNVAFTRGIDDAVKEALKSDNAALIDAFHDVVVDQLYQELVSRGKLPQPR